MSLLKEERTSACSWELTNKTLILLETNGSTSEGAVIFLSYEFHSEFDSYVVEEKKKEQTAY